MADHDKILQLRSAHKLHLIQNPNYFGNLSDLKIDGIPVAVLNISGDTTFEELTCLGLNPASDVLTAIVEVKLGSGYLGDSCSPGSREYVRFYLDYGDGTWIDHGTASFQAHDLGFDGDLCYAVSIKLDPKRRSCCDGRPVLPVVRAILSWNIEPPPGMPNWPPVWGNRLERQVQVAPRNPLFCKIFDLAEAGLVQTIGAELIAKLKAQLEEMGPVALPVAPIAQLIEKVGKEDKQAALRLVWPMVAKLAADQTDIKAFEALKSFKQFGIDLAKFDDFIFNPKFDTGYEELHCVGLDRDMETLHGIVQIKRPFGYSGDLCTNGSREYIAFYLDFGSGWEYQGTTWVDVHDIDPMPKGGLWYQASLPVNLAEHKQEWCKTGQARVRGVLSWAVPPMANAPDFIPHWGDREDCTIEIRPWPKGHTGAMDTPFLESIGSMFVDQIDGAGFADGASIGGTFTASRSPFGGLTRIAGLVAFPSPGNLEYRVMVKGPSDAVAKAWTKNFTASVTTIFGGSITFANVAQVAIGDWFPYLPKLGPVFKSVAGNLLAPFTATEEGLHTVYIDLRPVGSIAPPISSAVEAFFVDNTSPAVDIEITSGGGNCSKFKVGEVLVGTYSMADAHASGLTIYVTPFAEATGGLLAITSVVPAALNLPPLPGPSASNSLSVGAFTMSDTGASGQWELDTSGMQPCGFNITVAGSDRTIVNSGYVGFTNSDIEGFCLD